MKRVVKKFQRPEGGRVVPRPSSPPPPPAVVLPFPPRGIPDCAVDLSGLPPPDNANGWELAGPFIQKCYEWRCVSDRREVAYVRELYEALFGKEKHKTNWEVLKARICYHLQYLGFSNANRLAEMTEEVRNAYRLAWSGHSEELKMAAKSPVVKTFAKRVDVQAAAAAAPKAAPKLATPASKTAPARPLPKGAVRIGGDTPSPKKMAIATPAAPKKPKREAGVKRAKFFDQVSAIQGVRWMFNNGIPKEAVQKVCKRYGVIISESSVNSLYRPGAKQYDGAEFMAAQQKELKAAAK